MPGITLRQRGPKAEVAPSAATCGRLPPISRQVCAPGGLQQLQLVVLRHLHHVLHLPQQLLALRRLLAHALGQHDGEEVGVFRTQRAANDSRVGARRAGREDVVALKRGAESGRPYTTSSCSSSRCSRRSGGAMAGAPRALTVRTMA